MEDFSFMTCLHVYGSLKGNRAPNNTRSHRRRTMEMYVEGIYQSYIVRYYLKKEDRKKEMGDN